MKAQIIAEGVFCLHADIKTNDLFEGIWPIPDGVSLNSYIVQGEKTALVDLVRDWTGAPGQLAGCLDSIGLDFSRIDYLILNHLEPDHTGWLPEFRKQNPGAEILATAKGINLVKTFYKVTEGLRVVKDGDTLDLGGGKVLRFFETPNIHWPETMLTWEPASGTLFTCDAFGSFGALGNFDQGSGNRVFDDEFNEKEHAFFEAEGLRYFANILSSFSPFVERAVQKIAGLNIKCVAPSHGLVWRKEPKKIIDQYLTYASWAKGPAEKKIAVIWGSMYGLTQTGVEAVIRGIEKEGVPYTAHRIPDENISWVLTSAYQCSGIVLAMPTYEYAMFPPMSYVLDIFRRKHIYGKKVLRIGSWGWIGGAKKDYEAAIENLKWTSIESYEWPGAPTAEDLRALEEKGAELARALKEE
ncbi:MAG: FprA family A-type flavoprotein [Treponema sp.]|jgi:flavorubredoxin|nr:FprA family A-type flavoprotein [Treponema sp.]